MGLRTRLLLLVLLPTLPALLLALYTNLEQRRYATTKIEKDALKLVQVVAATQSGLIEETRGHLLGLSKFPQAYGTNYSTFENFFATMCKVYPNYNDFGIAETNGALISSAVGRRGQTNLADRVEFKRVLATSELAVGEFQPGNGVTKPSLPIAGPLLDPKGHLVRVLYASLDLAALNRALAHAQLPPEGVAEIFDASGHLLARSLDPEKWTGSSCSNSALFAAIGRKRDGTVETASLDGMNRLHAFTALRGKAGPNLFVTVGIPASVAYSETKHMLVFNLTVLGAVAVAAFLAAWLYANRNVLKPLQALLAGTRRVASGDLSARIGIEHAPAELRQLVQAFDQMAISLQQQRTQMEQAQEEIRRLNATLEARVTERTAQLAELNRQLESFSYSVSHDLRAPLRHISAFLEMLKHESGASFTQEARQFLTSISEAVTRMNALVEDLLDFARVSRAEIRRERVPMRELILEVQSELMNETQGRDIQWSIQPLPEVFVDRAMFKQVWTNLLANAVKYTQERERAEIVVGSRSDAKEIEFFVRDNGAGFDMRYADKLFGVFQRLHSAKRFEGTGVGLANVHRIVARHGGRVWAHGEVNHGATFWFSVPKPDEQKA